MECRANEVDTEELIRRKKRGGGEEEKRSFYSCLL